MKRFKKVVPADNTRLPGMHTLMADLSDRARVNYIRDVEYVQRESGPLCLQLLMPYNLFPESESPRRLPLVVYVQGQPGENRRSILVFRSWPKSHVWGMLSQVSSTALQQSPNFRLFCRTSSLLSAFCGQRGKYCIDPDEVAIWGILPAGMRH